MRTVLTVCFLLLAGTLHAQWAESSVERGVLASSLSPGALAGGVAFLDYNSDGWQDLFIAGRRSEDVLLRNNGDGTFTNVSEYAGINASRVINTRAVKAGDLNNDGHVDIVASSVSITRTQVVFANNGDGTFRVIIDESSGLVENGHTTDLALADVNNDGFLDIYATNYVAYNMALYDDDFVQIGFEPYCYDNFLYLGNGDFTFTEVTLDYGAADEGCGLASSFTDIDMDGDQDLYVINDFGEWNGIPNALFINNYPEPNFTNMAAELGLDVAMYGMGVADGDINRDGRWDYYITDIGTNVLHQQQPDGTFIDVAVAAGVENEWATPSQETFSGSWGTIFFDYDNDGWDDLMVANAYIGTPPFIETGLANENKLYRNRGDGTFEDVSAALGVDDASRSISMACGDVNNDGFPEVLTGAYVETDVQENNVLFYDNQFVSNGNHWFALALEGTTINRSAIGSRVMAYSGEDIVWMRELHGGSSAASQNSLVVNIGTGAVTQLDSVEVYWAGAEKQVFFDVATDKIYHLTQGGSLEVAGCMDQSAVNYDAQATYNYACRVTTPGCTDPRAENYDPDARVENGSCTYREGEEPVSLRPTVSPLRLYPNPAVPGADVTLQMPEAGVLSVHDLSGRQLVNQPWQPGQTLSTKGWHQGMYIVRVSTSHDTVWTTKLMLR